MALSRPSYKEADLIIVDGRNTLFRASYANAKLGFKTDDGEWQPTGIVQDGLIGPVGAGLVSEVKLHLCDDPRTATANNANAAITTSVKNSVISPEMCKVFLQFKTRISELQLAGL